MIEEFPYSRITIQPVLSHPIHGDSRYQSEGEQQGSLHALILVRPHSGPQLRTRRTLFDSWVWLGATEGLVAAGGMRLKPLAGQTLGFGYLCASHLLFEDVFSSL